MSINRYEPHSHFFVDHNNLYDADDTTNPGSKNADAFGPVVDNETTQYRTTSFVRASETTKVFAICDGHILIQPYDGDSNKVNLIIKPTASYAPLKIKYFIYRGVNAENLINGFLLASPTLESPEFIKRIWKASNDLAVSLGEEPPSILDGKFIGYDDFSNDELLSYIFMGGGNINFNLYNIPKCLKGELIGDFTDRIGLDIVLDYGDYELDYEEQLFKLDIEYAPKPENIFDVSTITGTVKQKRYREYIHQFLDAAAFWGSHIDCGEIFVYNDTEPKTGTAGIYSLVSKYQTANKLYLYIESERGRSFNYYNNYPTGKLNFELAEYPSSPLDLVSYESFGWPLLIKSFEEDTSSPIKKELNITLDFSIDTEIHSNDKYIGAYLWTPYWKFTPFLFQGKGEKHFLIMGSNGKDKSAGQTRNDIIKPKIKFFEDTSKNKYLSITSFIFIKYKGLQKHPRKKYFENLFGLANVITPFRLPQPLSNEGCYIININKDGLCNLNDIVFQKNAVVKRKLVIDRGVNASGIIKRRRLIISFLDEVRKKEHLKYKFSNTSSIEKN